VHDVEAFVTASRKAGGEGHVADLLQLDAGLRLGEVGGLEWPAVWWGKDGDDPARALRIHATRPRGRGPGGERPKSGREREVALSRRLRTALLELWIARGRPEAARVVLSSDQSNYRKRHFARVCKAAKLGARRPKDLRDTFASQLLTVGIPLGYVSEQLGHADVAVTARHYARYLGAEGFRTPLALAPGEVPADLLARLGGKPARRGRR
jgi:integrase